MITVGTDTYVTVQEATEYIHAHYVSGDKQREAWTALEEENKEVYLRNATQDIGRLSYRGVVRQIGQPLSFPRSYDVNARYISGAIVSCDTQFDPAADQVPDAIKTAQIEEALELAVPGNDSKTYAKRKKGIKAYSIGHFSETYGDEAVTEIEAAIVSTKAQALLAPYIGGGYVVR